MVPVVVVVVRMGLQSHATPEQDVHADLRGTTVLMRSSVPALLLESKEYHILACQQRPSNKGKRVAYR